MAYHIGNLAYHPSWDIRPPLFYNISNNSFTCKRTLVMITNPFFSLNMKLNFLIKTLACIALVATLFACQDHSLGVEPQRFRLKKTVASSDLLSTPTTTIYNYDNDGKLVNYSFSSVLEKDVLTTLHYDSQGRLSDMAETKMGATTGRATYLYDGNGNISSITKSIDDINQPAGNLAISFSYSFEYGPDKLPTKVYAMQTGYPTSTYEYTYVDGNIVKSNNATYTFDTNPNPYRGLLIFRQQPDELINTINKNNFNPVPSNSTLEYNSNGLLSKRTMAGPFNFQTTYEYEAY